MNPDKVTITITLERLPSGTVNQCYSIDGEGFMIFEIIGLMEMVKARMMEQSIKTAEAIKDNKNPTRIIYDKPETN